MPGARGAGRAAVGAYRNSNYALVAGRGDRPDLCGIFPAVSRRQPDPRVRSNRHGRTRSRKNRSIQRSLPLGRRRDPRRNRANIAAERGETIAGPVLAFLRYQVSAMMSPGATRNRTGREANLTSTVIRVVVSRPGSGRPPMRNSTRKSLAAPSDAVLPLVGSRGPAKRGAMLLASATARADPDKVWFVVVAFRRHSGSRTSGYRASDPDRHPGPVRQVSRP